jgi:hypothetical protein
MKFNNACMCSCHQDGLKVMHCFACCELCYDKYIDKDGNLDIIRFNKLSEEAIQRRKEPPYIDSGEYVVKNKNNYNTSYVKETRK